MKQLVDNRYRIVRPLGSGGMAAVYLAHDDVLDRDVALKVMNERYAHDGEFVERFKREAQSAAALSHPRIVSIYDRGESEDGTYYIAMEYLPGGTLKDRILDRGALPARTAAAVALQIAEALQAAHQAGVIHRDIKPHNVLVTATGDIKVGDFGIARAASSSTMTKTGSILGTAHYISPEQAMGEPVGQESDLYSLGVVLYEMLTGTLPYDADTPIGIAMKHVNGYLVPPREVNPEVPEGINAITIRLLEKNPDDRYADATELIEDLERVLGGRNPARATTRLISRLTSGSVGRTNVMRASAPPKTRPEDKRSRRRQRRWVPVLMILLLLFTLLGALAYATLSSWTVAPQVEVPDLVGASSIEEAQTRAGDAFEVVEDDPVESEYPVGTVARQTPAAGEMVPEGSRIYVDITQTQVAEVPDVEGQAREDAEQMIGEAGFEVEVETEESSAGNMNYVTGQDPRGGEGRTAEVGSTVTITVGAGPSPAQVPDLYNRTVEEARRALEAADLSLGNQTQAPSERVPAGQIVEQNPAAGAEVEPESSVDVVVSSGPTRLPVPDVVGRGVEEAKQTVWNAGFGYEVVTVENDLPLGTVISTEPTGGTLLDPASSNVIIRVSAGPPPPPPPPPSPPPSPPPANDKAAGQTKTDSKTKSSPGQ